MKGKTLITVSLLPLIFLLLSCGDPYSVNYRDLNFLDDGQGFCRFYAETPAFCNSGYYRYSYASIKSPMDTVETRLKKISGYLSAGYGIVFCLQDSDNYYRLLITNGAYYISKRLNGSTSNILDLTLSDKLNIGYDVINVIKVTYDSAGKTFSVYFNDNFINSFVDDSFSGGYSGFYVSVGSEDDENFPDEPVDVRFKQIQPVNDP